MEIVNQLNII